MIKRFRSIKDQLKAFISIFTTQIKKSKNNFTMTEIIGLSNKLNELSLAEINNLNQQELHEYLVAPIGVTAINSGHDLLALAEEIRVLPPDQVEQLNQELNLLLMARKHPC